MVQNTTVTVKENTLAPFHCKRAMLVQVHLQVDENYFENVDPVLAQAVLNINLDNASMEISLRVRSIDRIPE